MGIVQQRREMGKKWETYFCQWAASFGKSVTPQQIGRKKSAQTFFLRNFKWHNSVLPDIVVWTAPGEHHEIKHKNPARDGLFGLEEYRFEALLWFARETKQDVMYTIHNWEVAGGRDVENNFLHEWFTVNVLDLENRYEKGNDNHPSIINGQFVPNVFQLFWSPSLWMPLAEYWVKDFYKGSGP